MYDTLKRFIKQAYWLAAICCCLSCIRSDSSLPVSFASLTTEAKGLFLSGDSLPKPGLVPAGKALTVKAGTPQRTDAWPHADTAWQQKIIPCGLPPIQVPGLGACLLPTVVPAQGHSITAGLPEMVAARAAAVKDLDPGNFSFFKTLEGLSHNGVRCVFTDKRGNIWIGTNGGGASRYDGNYFLQFTEKQGLGHQVVLSILEDQQGTLWFGTAGGGVSRYNGKSFTHFNAQNGLGSDFVYSILEDRHGNIWFGTYGGGAVCYDGKSFTRFTQKQGLLSNDIYSLFEDRKGNIWFGTKSSGVSCYNGREFRNFTKKEGLCSNHILSIAQDREGRMWFGSNGAGLSRYDGNSLTQFSQREGSESNIVTSILQDKSGTLWFGGYGGLTSYTAAQKASGQAEETSGTFVRFTEKDGLSNNWIYSISEDNSGGLWLGTFGGGVCYYGGKSFRHYTETEGLGNSLVNCMLEDKNGKLWFGTNGGGLSCYDEKTFARFTRKEGLRSDIILSLAEDNRGNIWFGTNGGGVSCYDGKSFSHLTSKEGLGHDVVSCILQDKAGYMWFGTYGGGVSRYDGKHFMRLTQNEGLSDDYILCMIQDSKGNLWFGTDGNGLCRYNAKEHGSFARFTEKEGLNSNTINAILEDKQGNLWFGNEGGGVSRYDGKHMIHFTEREGLSHNAVQTILQDAEGAIWLGTKNGLSKISAKHLARLDALATKDRDLNPVKDGFFYNFGPYDGFLGVYCRRNSVLQDSKGYIWWGSDLLSRYDPKGYLADSSAPVLRLSHISLFEEDVNWATLNRSSDTVLGNGILLHDICFDSLSTWYHTPQRLSLPYDINHIGFRFEALHLQSRHHIKYQYQLEGMDPHPSSVTSRAEASYGNLPGGNYVFKVKAMNQSGVWSKPFSFAFEVRLPWWETSWFRLSALGLFLLLITGVHRWRTTTLRKDNIKLDKKVKARTREVIIEKKIVEKQKQIIEEKHKEMTDSIHYAERIQRALLANKKLLDEHLRSKDNTGRDYFIFFRPKDVVSGDFYHAVSLDKNNFILTTADSTGHGVPGAIMSILNMACLDKAIGKGLTSPELILNETRKLVIESLRNDGSAEGGRDGMDGCMLSFDFEHQRLHFAGANNPAWVIRGREIIELKANRFPLGKHDKDQTPFSLFTLPLQKQDMIYCFTDGFPDQFGGPNGKKFKHKQLQQLFLAISQLPLAEQKQGLSEAFDSWKGEQEQVDDVTVIGIRI